MPKKQKRVRKASAPAPKSDKSDKKAKTSAKSAKTTPGLKQTKKVEKPMAAADTPASPAVTVSDDGCGGGRISVVEGPRPKGTKTCKTRFLVVVR